MILNKKNLVFYCPSKILGGTEILFYRLIKMSAAEENLNIILVDIKDGILSQLLKEESNIQIEYGNKSLNSIDDPILVTAAKSLHELYEFLKKNYFGANIYIWQLGNGGFSESLILPLWLKYTFRSKNVYLFKRIIHMLFFSSAKRARTFVANLQNKKSLAFTDVVGAKETFSDIGLGYNLWLEKIAILPVFVDKVQVLYKPKEIEKDKILRVGWLGRISHDFKIYSLLKTIDLSFEYAIRNGFVLEFHIVGDGDAMDFLKNRTKYLDEKYFRIEFYGIMENEVAVKKLLQTVDLAVAMGASALDLGRVGIPTIIVSPLTHISDSKNIKFRWLYESKGYSLGEFPNNVGYYDYIDSKQLNVLFDEFLENKEFVSKSTVKYVQEKHEKYSVFIRLIHQIQLCKYTTSDFVSEFDYFFRKRIFFKKASKLYKPNWLP